MQKSTRNQVNVFRLIAEILQLKTKCMTQITVVLTKVVKCSGRTVCKVNVKSQVCLCLLGFNQSLKYGRGYHAYVTVVTHNNFCVIFTHKVKVTFV